MSLNIGEIQYWRIVTKIQFFQYTKKIFSLPIRSLNALITTCCCAINTEFNREKKHNILITINKMSKNGFEQ